MDRKGTLRRIGHSLVSWWEIPPRSMIERDDVVRFAHAIATLARQLVMAACALNDTPLVWRNTWPIAPPNFAERLAQMTSLADRERSATLAEELTEEMLALMKHHGAPEVERRLGRWLHGPLPAEVHRARVEGLARSIFERAHPMGALAALIADSWARGYADNASDVDIRLIVKDDLPFEARRTIVEPLAESTFIRQYGDEAYITADQFVAMGRKVDVKYHPVRWLERALEEPFARGGPIDLLELLEVHIVVADPMGVFADLNAASEMRSARAAEVADVSLAALRAEPFLSLHRMDAPQAMATAMGPGLEYLVRAWAGLNGRIHAFPKWTHMLIPTFTHGPFDGWERLRALVTRPWTAETLPERVGQWRLLVDELNQSARSAGARELLT